jgi:hypothetical protein
MSINLQDLADNSVSDRNFRKLAQLVIDTGGKDIGIRWGSGTWTWPGGQAASSATVVTHGLGRTPVLVGVFSNQDQGATEVIIPEAFSYTSTQFSTRGVSRVGTLYGAGTTATFVWLAIG